MSIKNEFLFLFIYTSFSAGNAKKGEKNKNFCENYHIYMHQFHYKNFLCVKTLKFFNLDTAGESVTPTSLLTLISAGPLEYYVQNMASGILKSP